MCPLDLCALISPSKKWGQNYYCLLNMIVSIKCCYPLSLDLCLVCSKFCRNVGKITGHHPSQSNFLKRDPKDSRHPGPLSLFKLPWIKYLLVSSWEREELDVVFQFNKMHWYFQQNFQEQWQLYPQNITWLYFQENNRHWVWHCLPPRRHLGHPHVPLILYWGDSRVKLMKL